MGLVRFVYVDPLNTSILMAAQTWYGVCRSTDAGVTWTHNTSIHEAHAPASSPLQPQTVYIGATKGIYRTTDAGASWSGPYQPPYSGLVDCILTFADSAGQALATNGSGVLRTTDQWGDWGSLGVLDTVHVTALAVSNNTPQNTYAAIAGFGVFSSTDDGQDWSRCRSFVGADSVVCLAANSNDLWALADTGLYYSVNGGGTWTLEGDWFDSAGAVAVSPLLANITVATGQCHDSLAVSSTTDRGQNWEHSLLCAGGMGRAVVGSPVEPGRFVVGGDSAGSPVLFSTRDTGRTWLRVGSGLDGVVHSLLFPNVVFLFGGTSAGVFTSNDTGRSWQYGGLSHVNSIVRTQYGDVLVGTDSGAYANWGSGWRDYSGGLLDSAVTSIELDPSSYYAFAGTRTAGLFIGYEPEGINEGREAPARPWNSGATITRGVLFLAGERGAGNGNRSALVDVSGRRVMNLRPGANDVSRLSPGVYLVLWEPLATSLKPQAVRKVVIAQ